MASAISFSRFPSPPKNFHRPSIPPSVLLPAAPPLRRNLRILRRRRSSGQENSEGTSETLAEKKEEGAVKVEEDKEEKSRVYELVGGVGEEVREIEWPEFGKVRGITGVVLAVIAGSGVALLTVNGILAELSDQVFAGKGVQDFFSG